MVRRSLLVPIIGCLAVMVGCQSSPAVRKGESGLGLKPSPAASPVNPLSDFERSLIFAPSRYPASNWQPTGLAFEDAWFTSADGTKLHGWYIPHERPRAAVLYCHGNGGNLAMWADALRTVHNRIDVTVMGFDYRGYGRSEGTPSEEGVLADARAARTWLSRRAGIAESQIVLMGRSLGGAVAVDLATDGARGLVLESTFTSLPEVGHVTMPWLPVRTLMQSKFNSLAKIGNYYGPLLQCHGTADRLIPFPMGRKLFEAANEPKQFVAIEGRDHNDPQTDKYYVALSEFVGRL